MSDARSLFEISGDKVLLDGQPLAMSADGFEVLYKAGHCYSEWLKDAKHFYYLESCMAPHTLKKLKCGALTVINADYAKGEKNVYWGATPIPGADPMTFSVVAQQHYFAYDKNQLYALSSSAEGLQIWTDVDTTSLEFFDEKDFFADRNHLYHFNWHFITYVNPQSREGLEAYRDTLRQRQPGADAWWNWSNEDVSALRNLGHSYRGDDKRVFYHFAEGNFEAPFNFSLCQDAPFHLVVAGADSASFQSLNAYYGKDQCAIYHWARPLDADFETFRVIDGPYAVDRSGIWFNGYLCPEADAATFQVIYWNKDDSVSFVRDKSTLFSTVYGSRIGKFKGYSRLLKPIKHSHPDSFVKINDIWAKDNNNVYCYDKVWSGIDAGSFEFLFTDPTFTARSYAKCKNGLYDANGRRVVKGIDGANFQMLNAYWGKDLHNVYSFKTGRIQKRIDATSFVITDAIGGAKDNANEYSLDSYGSVIAKKR